VCVCPRVQVIRNVQKYRDAAEIELDVLATIKENDAKQRYRCLNVVEEFDFHGHKVMVFPLLGVSVYDFLRSNSFRPFVYPTGVCTYIYICIMYVCICIVYMYVCMFVLVGFVVMIKRFSFSLSFFLSLSLSLSFFPSPARL
jgi:hypothetical protein